MSKMMKAVGAVALAAGMHAAGAATLLLDNFSVSQDFTVVGGTSGGNVVQDASVGCVNILGCYRDIWIDASAVDPGASVVAKTFLRSDAFSPLIGGGFELTTSVGSGDQAKFVLTWDGDATTNNNALLLGADLSAFFPAGGLEFLVTSDGGIGGSKQVKIELVDVTGKKAFTQFPAENTAPGPDGYVLATFAFGSEFLIDAGFDWSQVGRLQATVDLNDDTRSLDFAIRAVQFVVPEPASLALSGLALLGLGLARRRKA